MINIISRIIFVGVLTTTNYAFAEENQPESSPIKSTTPPSVQNSIQPNPDPFEDINRKIFAFNNVIDVNLLRPAAVQYQTKLPEEVRSTYGNFRNNLREPWNATNQLLQGDFKSALTSLGRFTINTVTSLGFADTAKHLKLASQKEDFGTTLGVWGVGSGPYMVLPFLGPSTVRDTVGTATDFVYRPQSYIFDNNAVYWTSNAIGIVDIRSQFLGVDSLLQGDQYAAMRNVYLQQRAFKIANKRDPHGADVFAADPFGDEDFYDEDYEEEAIQENEIDISSTDE